MKNNFDLSYNWYLFKDKIKRHIPYSVRDFYHEQISCRIWPRQKWLTKVIPKTWADKDTVIELVLFTCLKNYVESELGKDSLFNPNRWTKDDNVSKHQLKFESELRKHYLLLTVDLKTLELALQDEWKKVPKHDFSKGFPVTQVEDYEKTYGAVNRAEANVEKMKDRICNWIVSERRSLWT